MLKFFLVQFNDHDSIIGVSTSLESATAQWGTRSKISELQDEEYLAHGALKCGINTPVFLDNGQG